MGAKNSKPPSQTVLPSPVGLTATTVDFDTEDLESWAPSYGLKSLTELKSNTSYKSNKSNVSNKSQKKRKSRKPEELR